MDSAKDYRRRKGNVILHGLILALRPMACGLWPVALILGLWPVACPAQQSTTLTYETVVFNHVTDNFALSPVPTPGSLLSANSCATTNSKCAIQNTGMGTHLIRLCVGGTNSALDFWLEASNDAVSPPVKWKQISPEVFFVSGTSGCFDVKACNYFNFLRLHLKNQSGTGNFVDAWYSGISSNCDAAGSITNFNGSQLTTFNPALNDSDVCPGCNFGGSLTTLSGGVTIANATNIVVYALSMGNPNTVPVFASLNCPGIRGSSTTAFKWEVPPNDTRPMEIGTVGYACPSGSSVITMACSTSATSAVDPANACLANFVFKRFITVNSLVNADGTIAASQSQTPN